jgi:hypothetical protein
VGRDGSLCGYGGGLWRKRWLLQHERKVLDGAGPNWGFEVPWVASWEA